MCSRHQQVSMCVKELWLDWECKRSGRGGHCHSRRLANEQQLFVNLHARAISSMPGGSCGTIGSTPTRTCRYTSAAASRVLQCSWQKPCASLCALVSQNECLRVELLHVHSVSSAEAMCASLLVALVPHFNRSRRCRGRSSCGSECLHLLVPAGRAHPLNMLLLGMIMCQLPLRTVPSQPFDVAAWDCRQPSSTKFTCI